MRTTWKYLPILKWKRGERDALRYLSSSQWQGIVPLAEVQASLDRNAARAGFIADIEIAIPPGGTIGIDTLYLSDGEPKKVDILVDFCVAVQREHSDRNVIPVLHSALIEPMASCAPKMLDQLRSFPEIILRLRTDLVQTEQIKPIVAAVKKVGFKPSAIHLLIDQFSILDKTAIDCDARVRPYLTAALAEKCASVTIAGGSFPADLIGFKAGTKDIPRIEWEVWTKLRASTEFASIRYSDYAVTNPSRLADVDPTQVNPSISIRYAGKKIWRLFKGGGFKKGKPGTLRGLCKLLILDPEFSGSSFSYGDKNYDSIAKSGSDKNGIPWTWRRDATNHHIVLTAGEL